MLALPSSVAVVAEQLLVVLVAVLQLVAAVALPDVLAIFDVPTFVDQPFRVVVAADIAAAVDAVVANVDVACVAADVATLVADGHKPAVAVVFELVTVPESATDPMVTEYGAQVFSKVAMVSSQQVSVS